MPKTNNPHPHFRFVYVDLPIEWQESINKAYQDYVIEQVKQGKNPCKTDFVREAFKTYLKL
jgi:hypothetical protein